MSRNPDYSGQHDQIIRRALEDPQTDEEIAAADEYIAMMRAKLRKTPLFRRTRDAPSQPGGCPVIPSAYHGIRDREQL